MKKLLSLMLVLLMVLSMVACSNKQTPVEPDNPSTETEYEGLALNIKNKTGKTINEVYIYPTGGEKGNSVVEAGWKDKDADGENYEQFIYIVREKGAEMEMYVVFEDGSDMTCNVGTLAMYDKLSMKGPTADDLKHELNDDEAEAALMNSLVALGKTSDNFYPGYELIPVELKNKTGNDKPVSDYVLNSKLTQRYIKKALAYLDFMFKAYDNEEKRHLTICVGCTGRFTSISIVNRISPVSGLANSKPAERSSPYIL